MTDATVPRQDLWFLLLCTVRYSMGRCSYAPSLASELVLRYRSCLEPEQIEQIRDEVVAELKRCEIRDATLGHEIDHDGWWRLVERLGR